MKKILLTAFLFVTFASFTHARSGVTMTSTQGKLRAVVTLDDVKQGPDGRKAIPYRIAISSMTCSSVLAGVATYFSDVDDAGDDSAYLPNGYAVQINTYKDRRPGANVEMFVDVESKRPRYAYISVTDVSSASGGCIPARGIGIAFFSKDAYRRRRPGD
jgi:hypothetical protein